MPAERPEAALTPVQMALARAIANAIVKQIRAQVITPTHNNDDDDSGGVALQKIHATLAFEFDETEVSIEAIKAQINKQVRDQVDALVRQWVRQCA